MCHPSSSPRRTPVSRSKYRLRRAPDKPPGGALNLSVTIYLLDMFRRNTFQPAKILPGYRVPSGRYVPAGCRISPSRTCAPSAHGGCSDSVVFVRYKRLYIRGSNIQQIFVAQRGQQMLIYPRSRRLFYKPRLTQKAFCRAGRPLSGPPCKSIDVKGFLRNTMLLPVGLGYSFCGLFCAAVKCLFNGLSICTISYASIAPFCVFCAFCPPPMVFSHCTVFGQYACGANFDMLLQRRRKRAYTYRRRNA